MEVLELMLREMVAVADWRGLPPIDALAEASGRRCPDCQRPLERASLLAVSIDHCARFHHGLWLDPDELAPILQTMPAANARRDLPTTTTATEDLEKLLVYFGQRTRD